MQGPCRIYGAIRRRKISRRLFKIHRPGLIAPDHVLVKTDDNPT
jgi:hypothetical protein